MSIRIGTMDLEIAAIALANDATLLSRNRADFAKAPAYASRTGPSEPQLSRPLELFHISTVN